MDCSIIDPFHALETVKRTRETGNEHGFAVCEDGTHSEIFEGTRDQMEILVRCDEGQQAGVFHVHPNDVLHLSDMDLQALASEGLDMVCVGDTQGNVKCEFDSDEIACSRDLKESSASNKEKALATYESVEGETAKLAILPKGSRCTDWKMVPSRSDYHKSDEVRRCDHFDTGGSRDRPKDGSGGFKDKRMENAYYWAAQWRGFMVKGPHAGIGGTYYVEIVAGKPVLVVDNTWRQSHVDAVVDSMREHGFPRIFARNIKRSRVDREGWRVFMDPPTDDRLKSNYVDNWRGIDPTSSFDETQSGKHTDLPPEDRPGGPDEADPSPIDDLPEPGRWELVESDDSPLSVTWEMKHPDDHTHGSTNLQRVRAVSIAGDTQVDVQEVSEAAGRKASILKNEEIPTGENESDAIGKAVSIMEANPNGFKKFPPSDDVDDADPVIDEPPESVGEWELVSAERFEEPAHIEYEATGFWVGGYPATLPSDERLTVVVRVAMHGGRFNYKTSSTVKYWIGDRDGTADHEDTIRTRRNRDSHSEAFHGVANHAFSWMRNNEPADEPVTADSDESTYKGEEFPMSVNGWEFYEPKGSATPIGWYRPALNESNPEMPFEGVEITDRSEIRGSGTGFSVETVRLDADRDNRSTGRSLMPKKTSGIGTYSSVSFTRAVSIAESHMNEYDPFDFDLSYAPKFEAKDDVRVFKYLGQVVNRVHSIGDSGTWANVLLGKDRMVMSLTDSANVAAGEYEVENVDGEWSVDHPKSVKVLVEPLVEGFRAGGMTDSIRVVIEDSDSEHIPPKLAVYVSGSKEAETHVFPPSDRLKESIPEGIDEGFSAEIRVNAKDFKKGVRWVKITGDMGHGAAIRSDGDEADIAVQGDGDAARAVLSEEPDGEAAAFYSLDYLRPVSIIPRPSSTTLRIRWADEYPAEFYYSNTDMGYRFRTMVAPRVADRDPWKIEVSECVEPGDGCPFDGDSTLTLHAPEESETIDLTTGDVVLWFHPKAEGCRCSAQALQFEEFYRNHDAEVIGINNAGEENNIRFAEKFGLTFPIVSDEGGELIEAFGVETDDEGRPERTTLFLRDGEEIDRVQGMFGSEDPLTSRLSGCGCTQMVAEKPDVLKHVEHPSVVTITGKRRSGKSSLAYYVAEELYQHEGIQPVTVNVPSSVAEKLPDHWMHVSSIKQAPNGSAVVYDEAYRSIHSRTPMGEENLDLTEIVEMSAQRGQTILFVTQNSAILDKVAVGESDVMMLKKPGKLSMRFERSAIRDLSKQARERFDMLPDDADEREYVYVYGEDGDAFITNAEAPFYDDDISRSFAEFHDDHDDHDESLEVALHDD